MKTIIFVSGLDDVTTLVQWRSQNKKIKEAFWISTDVRALEVLKEENVSCIGMNQYYTSAEHTTCEELALELAELWFRNGGNDDFTEINGLSLGMVCKRFVHYYFNYLLCVINNTVNMLNTEKPKRIFVANQKFKNAGFEGSSGVDLYKEVIKLCASSYGFSLEWICSEKSVFTENNSYSEIAVRVLKKVAILGVDSLKSLLPLGGSDSLDILLHSATDINYLKKHFLNTLLNSNKSMKIYYLEDQLNCFLQPRIIHQPLKMQPNLQNRLDFATSKLKDAQVKTENNLMMGKKFIFKGISLASFMKGFFKELFEVFGPRYLRFMTLTDNLLNQKSFHLILITTNVMPHAIIMSTLGKQRGIPVFHLPHGFCNGVIKDGKLYQVAEFNARSFPYIHTHEVLGLKYNARLRLINGVKETKLIVGGMPQYENHKPVSDRNKIASRSKLGIKQDTIVLTFATESSFERTMHSLIMDNFEQINLYKSIVKVISAFANITLIFKFRFKDSILETLDSFLRKNNINNIKIFTGNLQALFQASDAVMVVNSNVGLEALFYKIPIIQLIKANEKTSLVLESENAAIKLKDPKQLPDILERLKYDSEYKRSRLVAQEKFLRENVPHRYDASEAISKIIVRLAQAKKEEKPWQDFQ